MTHLKESTVKVGQIYEAKSGNRYKVAEVFGGLCRLEVNKSVNPRIIISDPERVVHDPILNEWKLLPNIRQLPDHLKGKL